MHDGSDISVTPLGEAAWVVTLGDRVSESVQVRVMAVFRRLQAERDAGGWPEVVSVTPAFTTVTVQVQVESWAGPDPARAHPKALGERLLGLARAALAEGSSVETEPRRWRFPVCLETPHALDLASVAESAQVPSQYVIEALLGLEFRVHMLGFLPGFAYMGSWPEALAVPRRHTPRTQVPAGSVAVAETFCAIYPWDSPGGWHLLGHMPLPLFDAAHPEGPSWLRTGDRVQFQRIDLEAWAKLQEAVHGASRAGRPWDRRQHAVGLPRPAIARVGEGFGGAPVPQALRVAQTQEGRKNHPALRVLHAGLGVSLQDLGRPAAVELGVPVSGALDPDLLLAAQALLGQDGQHAALEILLEGPRLEVLHEPVRLAWVGELSVQVCRRASDGTATLLPPQSLGSWRTATLQPGEQLWLGSPRQGPAYLAVQGGWTVPQVLGSRASYPRAKLGGLDGQVFTEGDVWPVAGGVGRASAPTGPERRARPFRGDIEGKGEVILRVLPGPHRCVEDIDDGRLDGPFQKQDAADGGPRDPALERVRFQVDPRSDRMGWRLKPLASDPRQIEREGEGMGPPKLRAVPEVILSQAVMPGVVQWPPDGQAIILGPDAQTIGGYPLVAVVIQADRPRLARLRPGQVVRFQLVDRVQAHEADVERARRWALWRWQIEPDRTLLPSTDMLLMHNLVSGVVDAGQVDD